ncbi:MAG: hybrid sensor histidine kinase/response regulator [Methylobacter sp.]|nr:MAG: hybrid sensor histidine kinase/response regulator [Methylobacter sp.]
MSNPLPPRPCVLIIDDNITNIEVLAAALAKDYDISFATGGAEGIELAKKYRPDLILLDIMMPDMDGFETCRRLRNSESLPDIPIIFISALEEVSDKVKAFQAGGSDYVTKPFQPEEVQARVSTHTALYRARRALEAREESLRRNLQELEATHQQLKDMGGKLLQSEKLASIGQLAAGVAHEINNPIGFINSNLGTLKNYVTTLLHLLDEYEPLEIMATVDMQQRLKNVKQQADLAFLREDILELIDESLEGIGQVRRIVHDLRGFSHPCESGWQPVNLQEALESTLNVVWNEIKLKAEVLRDYTDLPMIECLSSQINQALLSLLVNAAQAIKEKGQIVLRTRCDDQWISIAISDNGCGIAAEHYEKIFDPFFTTKPIGKGIGLGLSIAYGIIAQHGGRIDVDSKIGEGSTFTIWLPIHHSQETEENEI